MSLKLLPTSAAIAFLAAVLTIAAEADDDARLRQVYQGTTTVTGEPIAYPPGQAEVHAVVVTLLPGEETGWHRHDVPLFAYVLEGEVEVDYGEKGTRVYETGMGIVETIRAHNGRNVGDKSVRILAVYMAAKGVTPTVPMPNR